MVVVNEIKKVALWLWAKRSEVAQMNYRDGFMAHIVLEILQTSTHNEFHYVQLDKLTPIHPVDNRENTIQATKDRVRLVQNQAEAISKAGRISKEFLAEILPSTTYIRAIPGKNDTYFTFEGNGRVAALKQALSDVTIAIEVDLYHPKHIKRSQKKIKKLRKMYKLD